MKRILILSLVATLLLAVDAPGQSMAFERIDPDLLEIGSTPSFLRYTMDGDGETSWSKSIGNSTIGAEIEATAGWWSNSSKRGVYGDLAAYATILGKEYEAAGVHAQSYNTYTEGSSSLDVVLADSTVLSKEWSADKSWDWSTSKSVSKSANFTVWIIPVTVKVEAGFSVEIDLDLNVSLTGVGLDGGVGASAYGSASGGIGYSSSAFELSLTLRVTLELFDLDFDLGAIVSVTGVSGTAKIVFNAVTLKLELVLTARALFVSTEYSLEIIDKSYGSVSKTLFSL